MAKGKPASLNGGLVRKGEAAPAKTPTPATALGDTADIPHGTKDTIAITVRLDPARYQRLMAFKARFPRRVKNQEIFVKALDAYLAQKEGDPL
jgi:hypothetical protein